MYFHVRIILHHLGISLPHEDGFCRVKKTYIKSDYYSIFGEYSVNANQIWMNGDSFYTAKYSVLVKEERLQRGLHQTTLHYG